MAHFTNLNLLWTNEAVRAGVWGAPEDVGFPLLFKEVLYVTESRSLMWFVFYLIER